VLPHYIFDDEIERRRSDIEGLEKKLEAWEAPALALIRAPGLARSTPRSISTTPPAG
jgi:hypothetical protein